jgi:PAS domain S-box-containing protein
MDEDRPNFVPSEKAEDGLLAGALESIDEIFCAVDAEWRFIYVNARAEQAWGRRREDLLGRSFRSAFPAAAGTETDELYRRVMADRVPAHHETISPLTGRWVSISIYPGADGGLFSYVRDISTRKANEEALRLSDAQLRAVFESALDVAFIISDPNGWVTGWNPGAEAIFGAGAAAMMGRDTRELFTPEDRADGVPEKEMAQARQYGRAGDDRWMQRVDGRRFWASGSLMPLLLENQPPHGFLKILRDHTAVHQAEAARHEAEDRLRLLLESVDDYAILTLDVEGNITSWNEGAARLTGYASGEILGRFFGVFYPAESLASDLPRRELATAVSAGRSENEGWRIRRDGSYVWVNEILVPMYGARADTRELIGFAKVARDLTGRRAVEEERERLLVAEQAARALAENASIAKDRFLALLSHELRTPLTPVLIAVNTLARDRSLSESAQAALRMIERNVLLEVNFIDGLLDLTRIIHGKLEITLDAIDLKEILRHAIEISASDFEAKKQLLTVALDADEHRLQGDSARLQQLFWNLLKNASKFTPDGGTIAVSSRSASGWVIVEVSDSGIGFAPETALQIFDAFTQASSEVTRNFGGLGLGLAIAKATAEAHGGTLQARSAGENQGATFVVSLPLA